MRRARPYVSPDKSLLGFNDSLRDVDIQLVIGRKFNSISHSMIRLLQTEELRRVSNSIAIEQWILHQNCDILYSRLLEVMYLLLFFPNSRITPFGSLRVRHGLFPRENKRVILLIHCLCVFISLTFRVQK